MSLVILEVDMGRRERKIAKDLIKKIPGVVDVDVHETGHVAIIGTADTATLKEKLEATLRRPVVVLADHRATPAPPHTYGYGAMPPRGAAYRRTPFGGIPSQDEPAGPVVFGVNMDVRCPRSEKAAKEDLMKIPGVVEVCASLVTGHVGIIGMVDAATLKARLESRLSRPAVLIADFGAAPAPPLGLGGRYGMVPPPSSAFPAPYNPYVGYHQPHYGATPSPEDGYYYTSFGRRPFGPPYMHAETMRWMTASKMSTTTVVVFAPFSD